MSPCAEPVVCVLVMPEAINLWDHRHCVHVSHSPSLPLDPPICAPRCLWYVPVFVFFARALWYKGVRGAQSVTRAWAPLMGLVLNFGWATVLFGLPAGRETIALLLFMGALACGVWDRHRTGQYELEDQQLAMDKGVNAGLEGAHQAATWRSRLCPALKMRDVDLVRDREMPDRFI